MNDIRFFLRVLNIQKIIDSLAGSRGITRNIIVVGPFLSSPVALSPLGVHQRNFDCQSGHPTGTEVFIGTTSGRSSGYKPALQAPVRVRRVVPANHRISSLQRDVVESVLFSGRPTITSASGNLRRDFDSIYRRSNVRFISEKWRILASAYLQMTNSIDRKTSCHRGASLESRLSQEDVWQSRYFFSTLMKLPKLIESNRHKSSKWNTYTPISLLSP